MASHSVRAGKSGSEAAGWAEMVAGGLTAWSELTQLMVDQAAAQAKALAELYAGGLEGVRMWPSQQQFLQMAEKQAEQFGDGCRHTLDDLERQRQASPTPILPD